MAKPTITTQKMKNSTSKTPKAAKKHPKHPQKGLNLAVDASMVPPSEIAKLPPKYAQIPDPPEVVETGSKQGQIPEPPEASKPVAKPEQIPEPPENPPLSDAPRPVAVLRRTVPVPALNEQGGIPDDDLIPFVRACQKRKAEEGASDWANLVATWSDGEVLDRYRNFSPRGFIGSVSKLLNQRKAEASKG